MRSILALLDSSPPWTEAMYSWNAIAISHTFAKSWPSSDALLPSYLSLGFGYRAWYSVKATAAWNAEKGGITVKVYLHKFIL